MTKRRLKKADIEARFWAEVTHAATMIDDTLIDAYEAEHGIKLTPAEIVLVRKVVEQGVELLDRRTIRADKKVLKSL